MLDKKNIINIVDTLKELFNKSEIDKCGAILFSLVKKYDRKVKEIGGYHHDLKQVLFDYGFIKNPIGSKYSDEIYMLTQYVINHVIDILEDEEEKNRVDKVIIQDLKALIVYTKIVYEYDKENQLCLDKNMISDMAHIEQLLAVSLFFQNQVTKLNKKYNDYLNIKGVTGLELSITNNNQLSDVIKGAPLDSLELEIESINQIVRYLNYKFKNSFPDKIDLNNINLNKILGCDKKELEEYIRINCQYILLGQLEEGVRYGYYDLVDITEKNQRKYVIYDFEDEVKNLARYCGIFRKEYQHRNAIMFDFRNKEIYEKSEKLLPKLAYDLMNSQADEQWIILKDFHPEKEEFDNVSAEAGEKLNEVDVLTKTYYKGCSIKNIKIGDYINSCKYICSLAEILYYASDLATKKLKDSKQVYKPVTIVDIEYLQTELCRLYGYKIEYSKKLIDYLTFHEKNNKGEDVFSNPLIQVSKTQVLICHGLINQLNIDRAIEKLFVNNEINVAKVGIDFEKYIVSELSDGYLMGMADIKHKPIPGFQINTNKVKYIAYDGREIEFDVISTIGDYLVLTELKSIMNSYSYSEIENRKKNIFEAKNQLIRRRESVKRDWNEFKRLVSIDLPIQPYDDNHIIMVACTDSYLFTPMKIGEVYVTDDSTYLKYFTAPYVESFSGNKNGGKIKRVRELWKNGEPDANEFISFLENPCTIHPYREYLKKELIPIPLTNEKDYYVFMTDYKLKEDPFMKAIFSSKVYPNDPCPCGSGKKYKKCCGRLF